MTNISQKTLHRWILEKPCRPRHWEMITSMIGAPLAKIAKGQRPGHRCSGFLHRKMGIRNDKNGRIRRIRRMAMCGYLWLSDFHNLLGFELLSQTWDEFRSDSHFLDQMFPTTVRSCCISISEFLDQCGNPPRFGMIISNSMQLI